MEICLGKRDLMIAGQTLRSILENFPQVLVTPLPNIPDYIILSLTELCSYESNTTGPSIRTRLGVISSKAAIIV